MPDRLTVLVRPYVTWEGSSYATRKAARGIVSHVFGLSLRASALKPFTHAPSEIVIALGDGRRRPRPTWLGS